MVLHWVEADIEALHQDLLWAWGGSDDGVDDDVWFVGPGDGDACLSSHFAGF